MLKPPPLAPPLLFQAVSETIAPLRMSDVPPTLVTHGSSVMKLVVGVGESLETCKSVKSVAPLSPEEAKKVMFCCVVACWRNISHLCISCCPAASFSVTSDAPQLLETTVPR